MLNLLYNVFAFLAVINSLLGRASRSRVIFAYHMPKFLYGEIIEIYRRFISYQNKNRKYFRTLFVIQYLLLGIYKFLKFAFKSK